MKLHPPLRKGERIKLYGSPKVHEVVRVSPGAAYVQSVSEEAVEVVIPEKITRGKNGTVVRPERTFMSHTRGPELAISLHTPCERVK